jgi:hypothetical protein
MKINLNFALVSILILCSQISNSQTKSSSTDSLGLYLKKINDIKFVAKVSERILGVWVNKKNGIQINEDKFRMLLKQDTWMLSANESDTYTFIGNPFTNTETVLEVWVRNEKLNREYISGKYENVNTKQYRMIKFELQKNNELKVYFSNVARVYDTDLNSIYVNGIKPNDGYIQYQTFEKLSQ